jgi:hypothetical protein
VFSFLSANRADQALSGPLTTLAVHYRCFVALEMLGRGLYCIFYHIPFLLLISKLFHSIPFLFFLCDFLVLFFLHRSFLFNHVEDGM